MPTDADKVTLGSIELRINSWLCAPGQFKGQVRVAPVGNDRKDAECPVLWTSHEAWPVSEEALSAARTARATLGAQIRGVGPEEKKALLHGARRIREVAATRRKRCDNFDAADYEEQARTLRRLAGEVAK